MRKALDLFGLLHDLRKEREQLGLSTTDVAQRSGLDRGFVSKLETGKVPNPTFNTLARYAAALGKELRLAYVDSRD
jgi:transcriptional regulator with XRE-family HTH domain